MGGKGWIMWSFIIYTACHILGYQRSGKMGKECSMDGSERNLEQIFDWKTGRKESIQKTCVNMGG